MTQDELLERLWAFIDDVPIKPDLDLAHMQREARYMAIFEALLSGTRNLQPYSAAGFARPRRDPGNQPFADATHALARLLDRGVTPQQLAEQMTEQQTLAMTRLAGLRAEVDDPEVLECLHEVLLAADPSDEEARPGSWPRQRMQQRTKLDEPAQLVCIANSRALALSPDGSRVFAAAGTITSVATGVVIATCAMPPHSSGVAWSPDGRYLAVGNRSGKVVAFDAATGKQSHAWRMTDEGAAPVFASNGTLHAADWNGNVYAWDPETGRELHHRIVEAMVRALVPARDGVAMLLSGRPRPVWIVNGDMRLELENANDFALDPSELRILVADRECVTWVDVATGAASGAFEIEHPLDVALSPDGRVVAITTFDKFRIGPADDLTCGVELALPYPSRRASFSADSARVALATWNRGWVYDVAALLARV